MLEEEPKKDPPLIERVVKALNRADNAMKTVEAHSAGWVAHSIGWRAQAEYKLRYDLHGKWFVMFERTLSSHLGFAERDVAHEEKLEADPKLKEM